MIKKFTTPHVANIILALAAFALFIANQLEVWSGKQLDLQGPAGAVILTAFLAVGILVQFAKMIRGHRHWAELVMTILLLAAHIAAEITIWVRTQILGIGIPPTLPLYIVGLYWIVGAVDVLAMVGPREAQLFAHEPEEARKERKLYELERELAVERTRREAAEQIAKQSHSETSATGSHGAIAVQPQFEAHCEDCGKHITADTDRGLTNAMNAHKRWCEGPAGAVALSENGSKEHEKESEHD